MDKKKKGILLLSVSGLLLVAGFLVWSAGKMKKTEDVKAQEQQVESVTIDAPEGESVPIAESKADAYETGSRKNIEDYWDDMAEEEDDLYADSDDGTVAGGAKKTRNGLATVEDFIQQKDAVQETPAPETPAHTYTREQRMADYQAQRQQIVQDVLAQQAMAAAQQAPPASPPAPALEDEEPEEEKEEEPEKIDIDRVMVRKSGSVSSLDGGGVSSLGGTGVSSLDGDSSGMYVDDDYPFKCMFVRQEKIRGGQRVTVRLLEDMVIQGTLVPKNTHLTAIASIGNRLNLNIANIEMGGHIYNLDYDAYDNDGTKGIYCPDISQDTKDIKRNMKQAGSDQVRSSRANSRVGGITQDIVKLGTAIVETSLNSNTGEMTVTVPEGYTFYIVKSKRKNNNKS